MCLEFDAWGCSQCWLQKWFSAGHVSAVPLSPDWENHKEHFPSLVKKTGGIHCFTDTGT